MSSIEVMKMALEALESKYIVNYGAWRVQQDQAITALRQALETEQEPVAFINVEKQKLEWAKLTSWHTPTIVNLPKIPLYTAPPSKPWVGLTDEEIDALSQERSLTDELMDCVDRLGSEADTVDPRVWQHLLVYAPKPEREWVGLTGEEIKQTELSLRQYNSRDTYDLSLQDFADAIEAKLKEKNHG